MLRHHKVNIHFLDLVLVLSIPLKDTDKLILIEGDHTPIIEGDMGMIEVYRNQEGKVEVEG
jgi:hypothetical protein